MYKLYSILSKIEESYEKNSLIETSEEINQFIVTNLQSPFERFDTDEDYCLIHLLIYAHQNKTMHNIILRLFDKTYNENKSEYECYFEIIKSIITKNPTLIYIKHNVDNYLLNFSILAKNLKIAEFIFDLYIANDIDNKRTILSLGELSQSLHNCIYDYSFSLCKKIIDYIGDDIQKFVDNISQQNILHLLAAEGRKDAIEYLHSKKNKIFRKLLENKDYDGCTPLLTAAENSQDEICILLIKYGANHLAKDNDQSGVLHHAAFNKCNNTINYIGTLDNIILNKSKYGLYPIHSAINSRCLETVKNILALEQEQLGSSANKSVFLIAASHKNEEILFHLLMLLTINNINILEERDKYGLTVISYAIAYKMIKVLNWYNKNYIQAKIKRPYLKYNKNSMIDPYYILTLSRLYMYNKNLYLKLYNEILKIKHFFASPHHSVQSYIRIHTIPKMEVFDYIELLVIIGHPKIYELIELGYPISKENSKKQQLLHLAAKYNNIEFVKYCIRLNISLVCKMKSGEYPITIALKYENYEIAKLLYKYAKTYVDINHIDLTILRIYMCKGHINYQDISMLVIINNKLEPEYINRLKDLPIKPFGHDLMHLSFLCDDNEAISSLYDIGYKIEFTDHLKNNLKHYAYMNPKISKNLLESLDDTLLNIKNINKHEPLHYAIYCNSKLTIEMFFKNNKQHNVNIDEFAIYAAIHGSTNFFIILKNIFPHLFKLILENNTSGHSPIEYLIFSRQESCIFTVYQLGYKFSSNKINKELFKIARKSDAINNNFTITNILNILTNSNSLELSYQEDTDELTLINEYIERKRLIDNNQAVNNLCWQLR